MDPDNEFLANIVKYAKDAILSKTVEGVVTSWNHSCEVLYGYSAEEMIGRSIFDIITDSNSTNQLRSALEQVHRGKTVLRFDTIRHNRAGKEFVASLRISPIVNSQGEIIGSSSIIRDVTEEHNKIREFQGVMLHMLEEVQGLMNTVLPLAKNITSQGVPPIDSPATFE